MQFTMVIYVLGKGTTKCMVLGDGGGREKREMHLLDMVAPYHYL